MAQTFHFGPYVFSSFEGLAPGASTSWSFGPFDWDACAIAVTAYPGAHRLIGDRAVAVSDIQVQIVATGAGDTELLNCTVRNVGRDATNYSIWIGGTKP
jgi:hypothetical protein